MGIPLGVLIVGDSEGDALLMVYELRRAGYEPTFKRVDTRKAMSAALDKGEWDIVLADYTMPRFSGPAALKLLQEKGLDVPTIIVSGTTGEDIAVEAMKAGANDYVMKSNLKRLLPAVEREISETMDRRRRRDAENSLVDMYVTSRTIVESIRDGLTIAEGETVSYVNDRACEIFGYSREELMKLTAVDLAAPEEKQRLRKIREKAERSGLLPEDLEFWAIRKDGSRHCISNRYSLIKKGDKTSGYLAVTTDITERKRAEESLRASESNYRALFEAVLDGAIVVDAETLSIVAANEAAARMYGLGSAKDAVGMSLFDFMAPEEREHVVRTAEDVFGEYLSRVDRYRTLTKDGREIWVSALARRTEYEGRLAGLISFRDITEHKQAEQALQESERRYRLLAQNSSDVIYMLDTNVRPTYVSPSVTRLLGYTVEEVMSGTMADWLTPGSLKVALQALAEDRLLENVQPEARQRLHPLVMELKRKDGTTVWTETMLTFLSNPDGQITGYVGVVRDITERKRAEKELRRKEEHFRSLIENSSDAISIVNADGTIRYVSPSYGPMLGYYPGEEIGSSLFNQIHPDDIAKVSEDFARLLQSPGDISPFEVHVKARDGSWRVIEGVARNLLHHPAVAGIVVNLRDITERKQAESKLQESENRFRQFFQNALVYCYIVSPEGTLLDVNLTALQALGYQKAELLGKSVEVIYAPESLPKHKTLLAEWKETGEIRDEEMVVITKKGIRRTVLLSASSVRGHDGRILYSISVQRDITERKQAEEALKREREFTYSLVTSMRDGLSVLDSHGVHTDVNPAFCRMTGFSREELVGTGPPHPYWPPESLQEIETAFQKTLKGEVENFELTFMRKDGARFPVIVSPSLVKDPQGNTVSYFATVKDITERKRMQEQFIITDRLASVGELASGITHEINNPLTSIIGFSELLLDRDVPDDFKEDLSIIHSEAQRAAAVVRNLLAFARKHVATKQLVSLNSVIEKTLELRAYEHRLNNIQVNTLFAPDLPRVMADDFQLQQVFLNIIINAEHFMLQAHQRGILTIVTERVGDIVQTSLADDGPGIAPENLGHIFDPFFTTKEVGRGTGLGLSICHGIITEHGGRIYAESQLGKGATFVIELPITK